MRYPLAVFATAAILVVEAVPLRAAAPQPLREEPTCKPSSIAWTVLGAAFGGLVGAAIVGRSAEKPAGVYIGPAVAIGAGAGYATDRACTPKEDRRR